MRLKIGNFSILLSPMPLRCWQRPWGFNRWLGCYRNSAGQRIDQRGWDFGMGVVGLTYTRESASGGGEGK